MKSQMELRADEGVGLHAAGRAAEAGLRVLDKAQEENAKEMARKKSMNRNSGDVQKAEMLPLNEVSRKTGVRRCF
jgi:hypothetical protein